MFDVFPCHLMVSKVNSRIKRLTRQKKTRAPAEEEILKITAIS